MSREEAMKFILTAGLKTVHNNDLAGGLPAKDNR